VSKSIHILYADDDEDDHIFFKEGLESLSEVIKVSVTSAYNGAEVLDFLLKKNRFKGDTSVADIIIVDLNMPVIDGYGLLAEMRNNRSLKPVPVYVLSVSDKEHDIKRCKELGSRGFYTKPVNFSKLTAVIKDILAKENFKFSS